MTIRAGGHVIGDHGWEVAPAVVLEPPKPLAKLKKDELLAAAESAGVEVDESMTKKEIVEALDGES